MSLRDLRNNRQRFALAACLTMAATQLAGCVVVGASSRGGFFIWPGGLGLLVIIIVVALLLRRR